MEFGVRVTVDVEYDDHIGSRDSLRIDFADLISASSLAEAAQEIADKTPAAVSRHLEGGDA